MKQNYPSNLKCIGLQFFADPDAGNQGNGQGGNPDGAQNQQGQNQSQQQQEGKTYTQEQINGMMANEKRTARQAIFSALGIEVKDGQKYEDVLAETKKILDSGKTQAQLDAEAKKTAETNLSAEKQKTARLEMQVSALKAGVNPDSVDDIITLALSKVSETNTIDKVLAELKTKYPSFFGEENKGGSGTGNPNNPKRSTGSGSDGLGKRLAEASKHTVKSSYFKN
jgi:hypothetical protein|nr:MAG TPA: Major capsid protein [Caudoviricetes sp.]